MTGEGGFCYTLFCPKTVGVLGENPGLNHLPRMKSLRQSKRFFVLYMPKTRHNKETSVQRVRESLGLSKAVVITAERKTSVKDMEKLRRELRAAGAELASVKKTLLAKAVVGTPLADVVVAGDGNIALAYSYADEISAAKIVHAFMKDHPDFSIVGGLLESRALTAGEVATLAKLPGKQELLGALVGTIAAPLRGFVTVLAGPLRGFVTVLGALRDAKS